MKKNMPDMTAYMLYMPKAADWTYPWTGTGSVSYTHLDVYKRQDIGAYSIFPESGNRIPGRIFNQSVRSFPHDRSCQ